MSTAPSQKFTVLVDDNFHYQDKTERYELGKFDSLESAISACQGIVEEYLSGAHDAGMSASALYQSYVMFGEDPFIVGVDGLPFSAWSYAKQRCEAICRDPVKEAWLPPPDGP